MGGASLWIRRITKYFYESPPRPLDKDMDGVALAHAVSAHVAWLSELFKPELREQARELLIQYIDKGPKHGITVADFGLN